ncbi:MAG: DUF4421 family protein [Vicingaceae bacterium]|nr:DUF4421 family protein [Vicingaceae bacterium]
MKTVIHFLILFLFSISTQAQVELDTHPVDTTTQTTYYTDYSDQLLLKMMSVVKSNSLEIVNKNGMEFLELKPHGISSLGFGFNYKWLGLGIAFGLPASAQDEKIYGKTSRFDFQLNIYSKKFVIDAFAQNYRGFHISNPTALTTWDSIPFPQRDSMQTLSVGVGGYYVFNNKKLSYKAAYVRNAVQKKSAGSFLLGGYYNIDYAGFDPGATSFFVPKYFPQEVQDSFALSAYRSINYGISFGYTYTFVFWKRFFINLTAIPGIGAQRLIVFSSSGEKNTSTGGASRFVARSALGYENKHFLIGLTNYVTTGNFEFKNFEIRPSTHNVKFFFAKRFNVKKKR